MQGKVFEKFINHFHFCIHFASIQDANLERVASEHGGMLFKLADGEILKMNDI